MTIPEYITIKTSNETVANLSPESDGLIDCYVSTRINGESTLSFRLPANSSKLQYITPECEIWTDERVYYLRKDDAIDYERSSDGKLWAKVMAEERWYELDTEYIEPYISNDPGIPTPADLAVIIVSGGSDLSGGLYSVGSAAHALYAILEGSDWSLGTVDVPGTHDLESEKESRLANIKLVGETWKGGIFIWDSINKTLSFRNAETYQPYSGFQIKYAKNLKHITKTQSNRIVTKLYPFGHEDLDIASVNDGKKYIENHDYTAAEYVGIMRFPDIHDAHELKDRATLELAVISQPRYLYKVRSVDLRTLPEYSHEDFDIGHMADIIDPHIASDSPQLRIMRHRYNLFMPWQCELDIGHPEERLAEMLKTSFNTTGYLSGIFNSAGKVSGLHLFDGSVISKKIADAAVDASKFNTKQIILTDDVWTDNSPSSGYVSWNSHYLFYNGVKYAINSGNTNKKYVCWRKDISDSIYQTYTESEFATITLKDYDFVIVVNNDGEHDVAWYNRLARGFVGSVFIADAAIKEAHIANLAVTDAKINSLSANKLTAGTIDTSVINITGLSADDVSETTSKKWAAESGATIGANWNSNLSNIPGSLKAPSGSGLYLSPTHLGFYDGSIWKTYMDNSGNFYLGGTGGKLQWNAATNVLTVDGSIKTSSGSTLNLDYVTSGTIGASYISVTSLSAINANLGTVTAGSITSNTTINVGTDARVGYNIYMGVSGTTNDRKIEFVDASGYEAYISFANSTKELRFYGHNDVRIYGGLDLFLGAWGDIVLSSGFGVYIGSSSSSNKVLRKNDGDSYYAASSHTHDNRYYTETECDTNFIGSGSGTYGRITHLNHTTNGIVVRFSSSDSYSIYNAAYNSATYLLKSAGWDGTFTNGDGDTVTVVDGQITKVT